MKRFRTWVLAASAVMTLVFVGAPSGSVTGAEYRPAERYAGVTATEVVDRVGEILAAIDSPQQKTKLAEQWLQFSKQIIAKDQEYRDELLAFQKQQWSGQQDTEQLRLQVAKLQMNVEELRAQNLRLERENLQLQLQLAQKNGGQRSSKPTPQAP